MEEPEKGSWIMGICSAVYLTVAISLLLHVCGCCYPGFDAWTKSLLVGREESAVREAFYVLSDGLQAGEPLSETAKQSFARLIQDED